MIHMPPQMTIDLFFSYISIPGAVLVALVLWGAWKLTEPEAETRHRYKDFPAKDFRDKDLSDRPRRSA